MIVAWTGVVHALALISLPPEMGNIDRWLDVMVTAVVVAAVVDALVRRNDQLFGRLSAEARIDQLFKLVRAKREGRNRSVIERHPQPAPASAPARGVSRGCR